MKQKKLKSKDNQSNVTVMAHNNGKLAKNKQGFVQVVNHPMYLAQLSIDYLEEYYVIPDEML